MFILIEIDTIYCGFGLEWMEYVYGIRLGWIAIHVAFYPFSRCIKMINKGKKPKKI